MPRAIRPNGIELEYETFGDPSHPPLLLVMGFTAQMIAWSDTFCRALAEGGRYVIRFDNRDCGLSSKLDGVTVDMEKVLTALATRDPNELPGAVPYLLSDMSDDAFAVLDALGIRAAHILGASMGGMIVQTMAIEHPERVLSLTSVMSTTGDPDVGQQTPEAAAALLAPPPADRDAYIAGSAAYLAWASKKYGDAKLAAEQAARSYDRSFYPEGSSRQLAAILASGSRSDALRRLDVKTLVIHGNDDTLIHPSGGVRTAEVIPGARLLQVDDMGHDLPVPLEPMIVREVLTHTA